VVYLLGSVSTPVAIAVESGIPHARLHFSLRKAARSCQGTQTTLWVETADDATEIEENGRDRSLHHSATVDGYTLSRGHGPQREGRA
jgi:hypothetical protein